MAIITLLLRHGASHFRVPLQHQLHSSGMLPTMVAQLSLDIRFTCAIHGIGMVIAHHGNILEPVKAHLSLLKD
jgi:hypothetical protein